MALKSTVFKADLSVADIDHNYYAQHQLTIARHPSETDERMMMRVIALALNAHAIQTECGGDATLGFGAGLSDPDDPDVWVRDYTGRTRHWIEVGQPEEKPVVRACSRADHVSVYCYASSAHVWWRGIENRLARLQNLSVHRVDAAVAQAAGAMAQRSMQLQATIQEGVLMLGDGRTSIDIEPARLR